MFKKEKIWVVFHWSFSRIWKKWGTLSRDCSAIKCHGRQWQSSNINIYLIWTGKLPAVHRQSFSPRSRTTSNTTYLSFLNFSPLPPSSYFYLYIYFCLINNCKHIVIINNGTKAQGEAELIKRTDTNSRILKVASGLLSCFPSSATLCTTAIAGEAEGK